MSKSPKFMITVLLLLLSIPVHASQGKARRHVNGIKDTYIIGLPQTTPEEQVAQLATNLSRAHGGKILKAWPALRAFLWTGTDAVADSLAADPQVRAVEQDAIYLVPGVSPKVSTGLTPVSWTG